MGVSLDDDRKRLVELAKRLEIPWRQVCDEKREDGVLPRLFNESGSPVFFVMDRDGRFVGRYTDPEGLDAALLKTAGP